MVFTKIVRAVTVKSLTNQGDSLFEFLWIKEMKELNWSDCLIGEAEAGCANVVVSFAS